MIRRPRNADEFQPGDRVVFSMPKAGPRPGPRAREIHASPRGEGFAYVVDKLWVVEAVEANGLLRIRTRRGKTRVVNAASEELRLATFWERLRYRSRFPALPEGPGGDERG